MKNRLTHNYKRISASGLFRNACCSETCPFYLTIRKDLAEHIKVSILFTPAFHKTILKYLNDPPAKVFERIFREECVDKKALYRFPHKDKFLEMKEEITDIICEIQQKYQGM